MNCGKARAAARAAGLGLLLLFSLPHAPGADEDGEDPHRALRVFSHASYRPYAYFENGAAKGLAIDLLRELARERGVPILMVTHDSRVPDIADRIVEMEDGRISAAEVGPGRGGHA